MLWGVGQAELLNNRRDLAVVMVVVGNKLAAAIGTEVLKAKSKRQDEVLHKFDQLRQRFVLHRDGEDRLELVVGVLSHEAIVPARRWRHGTQEVGADKLHRDYGLARV